MQWRFLPQIDMNFDNTTVFPSSYSGLGLSILDLPETSSLFYLSTIAFWILFWVLRDRNDPTRSQDAFIFVTLLIWTNLESLQVLASEPLLQLSQYRNVPNSLAALGAGGAGLVLARMIFSSQGEASKNNSVDHPWILLSRTTHIRMFPKRHSFAYSLLHVSIPVGFVGRCGSLISVDGEKKGWFHVEGSDYLDRNSVQTSLNGKLSEYLQSQGVRNEKWHHAYLVTAPRFFGYSFNPVSFWYIYTEDNQLSMMILEVNNTFDERRMYLLEATKPDAKLDNSDDDSHDATTGKFKNTWEKDFHVSPFNSRKGHYSLSAIDPFISSSSQPTFNNSIVLKSSKDHVKLVARVFSNGDAIDPSTASSWTIARLLIRWSWVGFFTFPRILKEAFTLFFSQRLHVWLRPEVLPTTLSRNPTSIELSLEPIFMSYLRYVVEQSDTPLDVVYQSPTYKNKALRFSSVKGSRAEGDSKTLEIRILSPVFFSRFVHYAHTSEAFDRECTLTDEKNRTIWFSQPALLPLLLIAERKIMTMETKFGVANWLQWYTHKKIRCPPAAPTYASVQGAEKIKKVKDIRLLTFSPLDRFVQTQDKRAGTYRRQCIRLFLAQRFAMGFTSIIDGLDLAFRVFIIFLAVTHTFEPVDGSFLVHLNSSMLRASFAPGFSFILKGY